MGSVRAWGATGAVLATVLGCAAAGLSSSPAGAQQPEPSVAFETVVGSLSSPVGVVDPRDRTRRLFIVEQTGTIRIFGHGELRSKPFLDISDLTEGEGERGLLGLAFHPNYLSNRRFFIYYTAAPSGTITVAEYKRMKTRPARANPNSARILLEILHPVPNHNGGSIAFGPDGYLYLGVGDGGGAGDPEGDAQRLDNLLGKQLRIDVDSRDDGMQYGIPEDNPFVGVSGAQPEIWAYGLRNPWRFSFDRATGDLWTADVGQNRLEEVNRAEADAGGLNYGWNVMEGTDCFVTSTDCSEDPLAQGYYMPLATYTHDDGCSVTGGYVYRGAELDDLVGSYIFADYCTGLVWSVDADGPDRQEPELIAETRHAFSSFGQDQRGDLYATDLNGELLRLTAP